MLELKFPAVLSRLFGVVCVMGATMNAPLSVADDVSNSQKLSAEQLIEALQLEGHVEGGYFRRTFQADHRSLVDTEVGERFSMTSIYYLLTAEGSIGHFHKNKSDILHFYHSGDPITYYLIHPDGRLETRVLGPDILAGQEFQFVVKGGIWKASQLFEKGASGYGLISEAVSPGFDYKDMTLGKRQELMKAFPQHQALFETLSHE